MRCKSASRVRVACAVFSPFPTCCMIASERAFGIVLRVIHVLCVPVFCLYRCWWMHVLRYPCSVRSFQLQKDRFWAWAEGMPQGEEEEEEQEDESSSSSASASGSGRAPTPHKKATRSTVLEKDKDKEKEKHKEKEKDKEKGGEAKGEALGQKTELAAAAEEVVLAEGAKGKEGKVTEGKQKVKKKGKEKAGGVGQVAFKIEGAVGLQKSLPAKTTGLEHYK